MSLVCTQCKSDKFQKVQHTSAVSLNGYDQILVKNLEVYQCDECGTKFVDQDLVIANNEKVTAIKSSLKPTPREDNPDEQFLKQ